MPKGRRNGKGAPRKRTVAPRPMNKPAMMDWALRLLRLLNEKKVLTSRIVEAEFNVNIRTAQRYLLYLSDLPCVVADEEKHTYTLTSDYVITDKILNTSEMALVCALIDYATHIFGKEHSKFLAGLKNRIFRMPDVYQIVKDDAIDMEKVAGVQLALERNIKAREVISFLYLRSGKRYTVEPCKILYHGPRQEILRKEKDGRIVVSFDVHNDMDFREHIARWMPYFRVLEPSRYREFIRGIATQVATRNEGIPV